MKYELIGQNTLGQNIYGCFDDEGICRITCTENDPDYQLWLQTQETSD
jgi:hypothetical protein